MKSEQEVNSEQGGRTNRWKVLTAIAAVALVGSLAGTATAAGAGSNGTGSSGTGSSGTGSSGTGTAKKPTAPTTGPQNLGTYTRVVGATTTLAAGGYLSATATCPAGQVVLGGGESNSAPGTLVLTDSWPSTTSTWLVYVKSSDTVSRIFTVYALCGT